MRVTRRRYTASGIWASSKDAERPGLRRVVEHSRQLGRGRVHTVPPAQGEVLSREIVQLAMVGPWVGGVQRGEYTVGVSGCNQRVVFTVICPDGGEGCFAAGPRPLRGWDRDAIGLRAADEASG